MLLVQSDGISCFYIRPFQIMINVGTQRPIMHFVATGVDAGSGAGIAGQVLMTGKTAHLPNLQSERCRQDQTYSRQALQALHRWRNLEQLTQSFLLNFDLFLNELELLEKLVAYKLGLGW